MKILLLLFLTGSALGQALLQWTSFKDVHKKAYKSLLEEKTRMGIFFENQRMIEEHNEKYNLGLVSYQLEMNQFGDISHEEFVDTYLRSNLTQLSLQKRTAMPQGSLSAQLPETVDWREKGAVTPIENQGKCGSCWAFSAVGALETQVFLKTGQLVPLSAQQLLDCTHLWRYRNRGCLGGMPNNAFAYIMDHKGIANQKSYPYEEMENWHAGCRYRAISPSTNIKEVVQVKEGDERHLAEAVANAGTLSVCVYADVDFRFYKSGVYYNPNCPKEVNINHAMLLVGYGTSAEGEKYWLLKNSWGSAWGTHGYIKMAKDKGNNCHVASFASYPVIY